MKHDHKSTSTELLVAASDISEAEAMVAIDAWVDHHGDDAASQLVEALLCADERGRGLGFRALLRIALTTWAEPAAGAEGLLSMVDRTWRVKLPETEQVLAAIGSGYPDELIAKAARKALFRH